MSRRKRRNRNKLFASAIIALTLMGVGAIVYLPKPHLTGRVPLHNMPTPPDLECHPIKTEYGTFTFCGDPDHPFNPSNGE